MNKMGRAPRYEERGATWGFGSTVTRPVLLGSMVWHQDSSILKSQLRGITFQSFRSLQVRNVGPFYRRIVMWPLRLTSMWPLKCMMWCFEVVGMPTVQDLVLRPTYPVIYRVVTSSLLLLDLVLSKVWLHLVVFRVYFTTHVSLCVENAWLSSKSPKLAKARRFTSEWPRSSSLPRDPQLLPPNQGLKTLPLRNNPKIK